jgi:hypothetical protein
MDGKVWGTIESSKGIEIIVNDSNLYNLNGPNKLINITIGEM